MSRKLSQSPTGAVGAIALLVIWLMASVAIAAAQAGAVVRPDPVSLGLKRDAEGTVALRFENVQDLYGLEVHLTFDPNVVQVVDADPAKPGVQIQVADWLKDAFVAVNRADNASGKIDFGATLLNPAPPVSGSRDFASITFKAKQDGVAPLKIDAAILATRDAKVIESRLQDGLVGVSVEGQAPTSSTQTGIGSGLASSPLIVVAGISILAFLVALAVLVYALRARRRPGN